MKNYNTPQLRPTFSSTIFEYTMVLKGRRIKAPWCYDPGFTVSLYNDSIYKISNQKHLHNYISTSINIHVLLLSCWLTLGFWKLCLLLSLLLLSNVILQQSHHSDLYYIFIYLYATHTTNDFLLIDQRSKILVTLLVFNNKSQHNSHIKIVVVIIVLCVMCLNFYLSLIFVFVFVFVIQQQKSK